MTRVFITGLGVVSPIGTGRSEFLANLEQGAQGIGSITNFPTDGFPYVLAAEARENGVVISLPTGADRKEAFFLRALAELFGDGRLREVYQPAERILAIGTGIDHFDFFGYADQDSMAGRPWQAFRNGSGAAVERAVEVFDIAGGHIVNAAACVASTQALGLSFRMLRNGREELVVSGGFDSMLSPLHFLGFYRLGALADWRGDPREACRPFDKRRCGVVLGEGAAVFSLEGERRVATEAILAEIVGYASTMDAYMVTDPEPSGRALAAAALAALADAGLAPEKVDAVHLHGTGTLKNDLAEARALEVVFGPRASEIPVFSLKGQVGHLVGACGAVEMLAVLDSLQNQRILPTVNFTEADPDIPLRVIRGEHLRMSIEYLLKINSGFGGQNSALVVRRHDS